MVEGSKRGKGQAKGTAGPKRRESSEESLFREKVLRELELLKEAAGGKESKVLVSLMNGLEEFKNDFVFLTESTLAIIEKAETEPPLISTTGGLTQYHLLLIEKLESLLQVADQALRGESYAG